MHTHTPPTDTPVLFAGLKDDADCAERLAPMWNAADIHSGYPASTDTVVELLRAGGGFDVSVELLEEWARRGMVPGCRLRSGRFAWTPVNIVTAAIQADCWRRFIPLDPRHVHRLTAVELAEAMAQAEGSTAFTDLDVFDCNAFVEILARCSDHDMRSTFAVALKTKLRALGVLDK